MKLTPCYVPPVVHHWRWPGLPRLAGYQAQREEGASSGPRVAAAPRIALACPRPTTVACPRPTTVSHPPPSLLPLQVRKLKDGVICGFAGGTADAMTLFERLETKLSEHPETMRACVEMVRLGPT